MQVGEIENKETRKEKRDEVLGIVISSYAKDKIKEMRKEKRDEVLGIRISSYTKDKLYAEAENQLMSVSELVNRYLYLILNNTGV